MSVNKIILSKSFLNNEVNLNSNLITVNNISIKSMTSPNTYTNQDLYFIGVGSDGKFYITTYNVFNTLNNYLTLSQWNNLITMQSTTFDLFCNNLNSYGMTTLTSLTTGNVFIKNSTYNTGSLLTTDSNRFLNTNTSMVVYGSIQCLNIIMNGLNFGTLFNNTNGFTITNDTHIDASLFLNYNLNISRPIISNITGLPSDNTQIGYKTKFFINMGNFTSNTVVNAGYLNLTTVGVYLITISYGFSSSSSISNTFLIFHYLITIMQFNGVDMQVMINT